MASNLSLGSSVPGRCPHRLTRPASALFQVRAPAPIRPVMREPPAEVPAHGPGFLLTFGHRHSLLGSSCARQGIPPSSRSAYRRQTSCRTRTGLSRSTCDSSDRGGRPLNPGDGGALPTGQTPPAGTRRLAATGPYLPLLRPICGSARDGVSSRIHLRSPVRSPPACNSRTEREPLDRSSGFAPHGCP